MERVGAEADERTVPILPPKLEGREQLHWDPQLRKEAGSLLQDLSFLLRYVD